MHISVHTGRHTIAPHVKKAEIQLVSANVVCDMILLHFEPFSLRRLSTSTNSLSPHNGQSTCPPIAW